MTPAPRVTGSSCRRPSTTVVAPQHHEPGWNEPTGALSHPPRPRPLRRRRDAIQNTARRRSRAVWMSGCSWWLVLMIGILICCPDVVEGRKAHGSSRLGRNSLHLDKRKAPEPRIRLKRNADHHDRPDGANANNNNTLNTAPEPSQPSLPQPFDSSLGNNFTAPSCPRFFNNFLNNEAFTTCLPFSLLLQTSSAFFTATRSLPRLTQTLDATCTAPYQKCSALMSHLATEIQNPDHCGADYTLGNPVVTQAYAGLIAYDVAYHAGCLKDEDGNYCFADAVTNASAPTSSYVYYLPLGVNLPGGTQPSCGQCLQDTMALFATYATNESQPLSQVYSAAAQTVDMTCGPRFAEAAVQTGGAAGKTPGSVVLGVVVGFVWLMVVVG